MKAPGGRVRVEVVYCPRGAPADATVLEMPPGATLAQALAESGVCARHRLDPARLDAGIWGRPAASDAPLREGDRVEVYRALVVDPKQARRLRYRRNRGGR